MWSSASVSTPAGVSVRRRSSRPRDLRPEVGSQDHADVHPPKAVRVHHHAARADRLKYFPPGSRIPPTHDDTGGLDRRLGIPVEHYVQTPSPEHPRSRAGHAGTPGPVQHLYRDAPLGRRDRIGMRPRRRRRRRDQEAHGGAEPHGRQRDQSEAEESATRRFQKRTVGSRSNRPELTRCPTRAVATSRSTATGSAGSRFARSARHSRACFLPGSR